MPNASRSSTLRSWQRPLVSGLVGAFVLAGGTGLLLLASEGTSRVAAVSFLVHVVAGGLAAAIFLVFAVPHALRHGLARPRQGARGLLLLTASLLVVLTGVIPVAFAPGSRVRVALPDGLHAIASLALALLYLLHRAGGTRGLSLQRAVTGIVATVLTAAGLIAWDRLETPTEPAPSKPLPKESAFAPSRATTASGTLLPDSRSLTGEAACAKCHPRITEEWRRSAHRHASFTNPFYAGSIRAMRERYAPRQIQWCAGCHDPALLFTGKIAAPDFDPENDPDARVGITCTTCHAVEARSTLGNADYVQGTRASYAWERSDDPVLQRAHDALLNAKPEAHVASLRRHGIETAAFCSVCHKAEIERPLNHWKWIRAQDTYDAWDDSGVSLHSVRSFHHPIEARSCRDCHMPLVEDRADAAADASGRVRSHLFAAANTALPFLRGDEEMIEAQQAMLRRACRMDVTAVLLAPSPHPGRPRVFAPAVRARPAVRPGEVVEIHVVVRNVGTGHSFPTGTTDSNEAWVRFEASADSGDPFWVSGAVDRGTGRVDPKAEHYRAYLADARDRRVVSRIGPDVRTRVYVRTIGPGSSEVIRYRLRVPRDATTSLRVRATLRYRKFLRQYIDFLFPDGTSVEHRLEDGSRRVVDLAELPILDLATAELDLPVTTEGTPDAAPPASEVARAQDLIPLNDLGVAYLRQEAPHAALRVFREVVILDPSYVDGWINLARVQIERADWVGALSALEAARERAPDSLKVRFFEGDVHRRRARYDEAAKAFRDVLEGWPRERMALRHLAQSLYELGRYAEALEVLDRLFRIDAADARGWFWAVRTLERLGRRDEAREAEAHFDEYRDDDDEPIRAGRVQLADRVLQRLAQPIHVHVEPGLPGSD